MTGPCLLAENFLFQIKSLFRSIASFLKIKQAYQHRFFRIIKLSKSRALSIIKLNFLNDSGHPPFYLNIHLLSAVPLPTFFSVIPALPVRIDNALKTKQVMM